MKERGRPAEDAPPTPPDDPRSARPARVRLQRFLELVALSGFAITQPLLSVFGTSVDTFIFRNATRFDIVAFAAVVAVVPVLILSSIERVARAIGPRVEETVHECLVAGLVLLLALHAGKQLLGAHSYALVAPAAILAAVATALHWRVAVVREVLRYAAPGQILFVLLFLLSSTVTPLFSATNSYARPAGRSANAGSVTVVVFDEWPTASIVGRDGNIADELFPNVAKLAGTSTWYRNATSISNSTPYAVPAILTGRFQTGGSLPVAAAQPDNLFSLLAPSHELQVFESVTALCAGCRRSTSSGSSGLRGLLGDAARVYRQLVSPSDPLVDPSAQFVEKADNITANDFQELNARRRLLANAVLNRPGRFGEFLDSFHAHERPTLHFVHLLLPHVPLRYLPSGLQYPAPNPEIGRQGDVWTDGPWPTMLGHQRALLQTAYVDRLVGELLQRLGSTGLLDSMTLVVTADHGIAYQPGLPSRGLTDAVLPHSLYPELLYAPLFVKAPNQRLGQRSDANVMSIDVLPTIASLTGVTMPFAVDGVVAGTRADTVKMFQRANSDNAGFRLERAVAFDGAADLVAMLAGNVDSITARGDPSWQLWRVGEYATLAGTHLTPSQQGAPSDGRATVSQLLALTRVDRRTGSIPAMIWGTLSRPVTVAVVVNGTVAGVSTAFGPTDAPRWAIMVPEQLLRDGSNLLQMYEVTGARTAPTFHRIEL
jgi:Sulfatase